MAVEQGLARIDDGDDRLIRLAQQGNLDAFELLVTRHQDRVFNTAVRLLGDYDDAADVMQEVFLSCFRKLDSFRGDAQFSTWLYRVTVNAVKNRWKHDERRASNRTVSLYAVAIDGGEVTIEDRLPTKDPSPSHVAEMKETHRILLAKLREMHVEYREVLVLRCIEGLAYEEIADILGCSLGTVKSRLHRARELIRSKMEGYL